jgi:dGTPase
MLASFASDPEKTKGRLFEEKPTPYRNTFERDRDRIIHSNAFKRLQYKTQVFVNHEGDHYRNRLTHSIEVSCVARSVAKALCLSDDLAEAVALAHDLGHTPFGHAGEEALNKCMKKYGGFSHNTHSLKILTHLEQKYAAYDGLNLSWEVLEGIVKHNGPLTEKIDQYIVSFNEKFDLDLTQYSSAEAQLASLSDDISYICHDLEDSVRANLINVDDLEELPNLHKYVKEVKETHSEINNSRLIYEVVRKLMHHLIDDLLKETRFNFTKYNINTNQDIRKLGRPAVDFSESVKLEIAQMKALLFRKVYKHNKVTSVVLRCQKVVKGLFSLYMGNIDLLPFSWRNIIDRSSDQSKAEIVADYIAGMTDRFAIKEYQSFYNLNFDKI